MSDDVTEEKYGVHSEVGKLRKVLVCSPGLAHLRLTPTNSDDLLFDDVMWVENAQRDHLDFVNKMRSRDIEVCEMTVEAAVSSDRNLILRTMLLDPVIDSVAAAEKVLDAMLEANEQYLARYR